MVLTAVVLLVFDRRLLGERKEEKGKGGGRGGTKEKRGEAAWVVGHCPTDATLLAWVRCSVEFLPAAILGVLSLSVFLLCSFFLSSAISYKLVLGIPFISVRFA
jgi:hypothetical protein